MNLPSALHLFADRARAGAYGVRFLYLGAMIGFFFYTRRRVPHRVC
ncbi:hypothetical protein [uncultured Amnibacterium sp.]